MKAEIQPMRLTGWQHVVATLVLGLPLIASHLAQMMLHVIDTVMMGWYGVTELAAMVIASSMFFLVFICGSGFANAVMPMVAQSVGAGNEAGVRRAIRMGLWLSIGFGLLTYPIFWNSRDILLTLGQKPEVAALGQDFLRIGGFGMIPALIIMAIKGYLAALGRTQAVLWVTLAAIPANAALNYALIFGNWGAPEWGIEGAAAASVTVQVASMLALMAYAGLLPALRQYRLFHHFWRPDWAAMAQVFRLGWPIGVTLLAETGLFAATAVMMGWIGTLELAAHGITLEITSLAFMVHLGLSNAATIRAGHAYGAEDAIGLRDGAKAVIGLSFGFALCVIATFLLAPRVLIGLFLDQSAPEAAQIMAFGVTLLAISALFQLADAMQVIAMGLLRGIHDTRVPMIVATISYWGVGMPAAYLLAFWAGVGGVGLWLGLTIGLSLVAVTLFWRFWAKVPQLQSVSRLKHISLDTD
jgi:MATE family multidrug resistance protein